MPALSGHHVRQYMMSEFVITGKTNFDHWMKVVFTSCLHCKVTAFSCATDKYLVGKFSQMLEISCFSLYFGPFFSYIH